MVQAADDQAKVPGALVESHPKGPVPRLGLGFRVQGLYRVWGVGHFKGRKEGPLEGTFGVTWRVILGLLRVYRDKIRCVCIYI